MKTPLKFATLTIAVFFGLNASSPQARAFDEADWSVRCWNFDEKYWEDLGLEKMTVTETDGATRITNTTGIHKHAHLVFPAQLKGDFTFTIEVKGGYELGFLNRGGKDEMLYFELPEQEEAAKKFETFTLNRRGSRISITRNGRALPLVHFRFDYAEDFLITLAIKDGESAEIRSYSLDTSE